MCIVKKKSDLKNECIKDCPHFKFRLSNKIREYIHTTEISSSDTGVPFCTKHGTVLERPYGGTNRAHSLINCDCITNRYRDPHAEPPYKEGVNVIVIDTTWKSLIGCKATVSATQDAKDPNKIRVNFDEDYVGYFYPEQLQIDTNLRDTDSVINYLSHLITHASNKEIKIEVSKLQNIVDILK